MVLHRRSAHQPSPWRTAGEAAPGRPLEHDRLDAGEAELDVVVDNRFGSMPLQQQRARLPIYKVQCACVIVRSFVRAVPASAHCVCAV